jgi:hypothetical protein
MWVSPLKNFAAQEMEEDGTNDSTRAPTRIPLVHMYGASLGILEASMRSSLHVTSWAVTPSKTPISRIKFDTAARR